MTAARQHLLVDLPGSHHGVVGEKSPRAIDAPAERHHAV